MSRPAAPQVSKNGRELISQHPLCKLFLFQYKSKPFVVLTAARPRAASARVVFVCVLLRERERRKMPGGEQTPRPLSLPSRLRGRRSCRWRRLLGSSRRMEGCPPGPAGRWAGCRAQALAAGSFQVLEGSAVRSHRGRWSDLWHHCGEAWPPVGLCPGSHGKKACRVSRTGRTRASVRPAHSSDSRVINSVRASFWEKMNLDHQTKQGSGLLRAGKAV